METSSEVTSEMVEIETIIPREKLQADLGYSFSDIKLLETALSHKSFANEQNLGVRTTQADNERYEFLGDAVLDLVLSDILMRRFNADPEGALSKKRASLVNEETLSKIAYELGLEKEILLGKGEAKSGGLQKPRILASALEAVFGAIFTDGGYAPAVLAIEKLFATRLEDLNTSDVDYRLDYKTRLQERVQEVHRTTPIYKIEAETGPDHDKKFDVSVQVGGEIIATGSGKSKKSAEQDAACKALEQMESK
jgi:ribonuclease III